MLTNFQPAAVLASARAPGGGRAGARLRATLVVVQFGIAVAFAIGTAVMLAQAAHVRAADLGFKRDRLFVVRSFGYVVEDAQKAALVRALGQLPGVSALTIAENAPGDQSTVNRTTMHQPGMEATRNRSTMHVLVGTDYFRTFDARVIAGRTFDAAHPGDDWSLRAKDSKAPYSVVINRTAATSFGFASPQAAIGKPLEGNGAMTIIGVVDDLRFRGPREEIGGVAYRYASKPFGNSFVTLRYSGDPAEIRDAAEAAWKRVVPMVPFKGRTIEENLYEEYYKADAQRARLFTIGAVLAVVIGCRVRHLAPGQGDRHPQDAGRIDGRRAAAAARQFPAAGADRQRARLADRLYRHASLAGWFRRSDRFVALVLHGRHARRAGHRGGHGPCPSLVRLPRRTRARASPRMISAGMVGLMLQERDAWRRFAVRCAVRTWRLPPAPTRDGQAGAGRMPLTSACR